MERHTCAGALAGVLGLLLALVLPGACVPTAWADEPVVTASVSLAPAPAPADLPATRAYVRTAQATLTQPVALVGLTLPSYAAATDLYVRTVASGQPSPWTPLAVEYTDDPAVPGSPGVFGTIPLVASGVQSVEAVAFSDADVPVTLAIVSSAEQPADAAPSRYAKDDPQLLSRRAWNADERIVKNGSAEAKYSGATLHTLAGSNAYTEAEVPGLLRALQAYDVGVRGKNDVAANVLVDRFGRTWEGRNSSAYGSAAGATSWAQTNRATLGVTLLGDFTTDAPTPALLDGTERVLAWAFRLNGVDPAGQATLSGGRLGTGPRSAPAVTGQAEAAPAARTAAALDPQLPAIAAGVQQLMATTFRLSGNEGWTPGNIVSDQVFYNHTSMTRQQVNDFVNLKGANCVDNATNGVPCLRNFRQDTPAMGATAYCSALPAAPGQTAGDIVSRIASACRINPQVLLVTVQKESSLLDFNGADLTARGYATAAGAGCPDYTTCDATQGNFFYQVYGAASQFSKYRANPSEWSYVPGPVEMLYSPEESCGKASFTIANEATAGLYNYTPHTPNAAGLAGGTGPGDLCSNDGNRNFFRLMKTWFPGSVSTSEAPPVQPSPASRILPQLATTYAAMDRAGDSLGDETSFLECGPSRCVKTFAHGTIYSTAGAAHAVQAPLASAYADQGGPDGPLGLPISDASCGPAACLQSFAGGVLAWTPAGGTQVTT